MNSYYSPTGRLRIVLKIPRPSVIVVGIVMGWIASGVIAPVNHPKAAVPPGTPYRFTRVASTGIELTGNLPSQIPEMTDNGSVLFTGELPGSLNAILIGNGGPLTPVTTWTNAPRVGISGNTLGGEQTNQTGDVVFRGSLGGSAQSVYLWNEDAGLRELYRAPGEFGQLNSFASEASINKVGQITFVASGYGIPLGVFVGDSNGTAPPTILAATGGPLFEGFSNLLNPKISENGTVFLNGVKNGTAGIYKLTGPGTSLSVAEVGSMFTRFNGFDVSGSDHLAFFGRTTNGLVDGIFLANGNALTTVALEGGGLNITNGPGLNEHDDVVFKAEVSAGAQTLDVLLTGPDPVNNRIIREGDVLLGKRVTQLFAGPGSINNSGQVAFFAERQDASGMTDYGIYIATPVPEPSGLFQASSCIILLVVSANRDKSMMASSPATASKGGSWGRP